MIKLALFQGWIDGSMEVSQGIILDCINGLKDRNHIILIDTEKTFEKNTVSL